MQDDLALPSVTPLLRGLFRCTYQKNSVTAKQFLHFLL